MRSRNILGVRVDFGMTLDDVISDINSKLSSSDMSSSYICTTNPEFIIDAQTNDHFKEIINKSYLSTPDGSGVIMADKYLSVIDSMAKSGRDVLFPFKAFIAGIGVGLKALHGDFSSESVTGVELTDRMCKLASEQNYNIFLLGGSKRDAFGEVMPGADLATQTATIMTSKYKNLNVIGATSAYSRDPSDDSATISYISKCMTEKGVSHLDMIFVAYNHIHQESWIERNSHKIPARVSVGVGGTFDYICGVQPEVPSFFKRSNLAWLYRLLNNPWRLKRVLKAFPIFPFKVFLSSIH